MEEGLDQSAADKDRLQAQLVAAKQEQAATAGQNEEELNQMLPQAQQDRQQLAEQLQTALTERHQLDEQRQAAEIDRQQLEK